MLSVYKQTKNCLNNNIVSSTVTLRCVYNFKFKKKLQKSKRIAKSRITRLT